MTRMGCPLECSLGSSDSTLWTRGTTVAAKHIADMNGMHKQLTWKSSDRCLASESYCFVTRYPGRPIFTVFEVATRRCGAGAVGLS